LHAFLSIDANASSQARETASEAPLLRVARSTVLGASMREPEIRRFTLEATRAPLGRKRSN
jgi:hypothetical protein